MMPLMGFLTTKVQARYLIAFGWLALSLAMFYSSRRLDLDISFRSAAWLRVIQVFGLGFLFVPINLASYVGMPGDKSSSVAGLVNFMRNIGSSVGTSIVTTLIARRAQVHQVYLVANVTRGDRSFENAAAGLTAHVANSGASVTKAVQQTYGLIYRTVIIQATTLAYLDTFLVLSIIAAIMFVFSFALKKNDLGGHRPAIE
jgi:DHA2 family multidrug resistance protein